MNTYFFLAAFIMPIFAAAAGIVLQTDDMKNRVAQTLFALGGLSGVLGSVLFFIEGQQPMVLSNGLFGLAIGQLSVFFFSIISLGVLLTSVYAIEGLRRYKNVYSVSWVVVSTAAFTLGMYGSVFSSSLVGFLIAWEIMSVAAYFLIIADRSDESLQAGFLYFLMTHIGFASLVAGFLILAGGNPLATWSDVALSAVSQSQETLTAAFLLLFVGFGSKAGLVPLHQWLPLAHPQAPSHASALLSGVMLKIAIFGFIQSLFLFPATPVSWGVLVLIVGFVSALSGVLHAAVENDIKRALAWSSIENMGLIFSALGALIVLRTLPYEATPLLMSALIIFIALHIVNHFLFKTGLFLAAGAIVSEVHSRDMDVMGGLAQKWPLFSGVFLALALAAAALPPFGTFFGEWMYLQTLALALIGLPLPYSIGVGLVLAVIAGVSGLAIFAFIKMFASVFLGRARKDHAEHAPLPPLLVLPSLVCALLSIAVGICAFPLLSGRFQNTPSMLQNVTIAQDASINAWGVWGLVVLFVIFSFLFMRVVRPRMRATDTWDCGQPLTPRMEYTATGFAAPIRFFFRSFLVSRKEMIMTPVSSQNPWIAKRKLDWSVTSHWERVLYQPLGHGVLRAAHIFRKLQGGVIQLYLLFVVIALAAAFIFAL